MFLIDQPYVSSFLLETIKDNAYEIVSTKEARSMITDNSLNWITEENAIEKLKNNPDTPLYLNSENAIAWIIKNWGTSDLARQIQLFKDKIKFRALIKDAFPNFFYQSIQLEDIQTFKPKDEQFPFVIKPALGFFSLGVHIVHNQKDWIKAKSELNYKTLKSIYPKEVLDTSTFIIEEYIQGEEYAIDCYYNKKGEVVILNILHHKFSSGTDVSDRVYSTSKDIFLQYKNKIEAFLSSIGAQAKLKNFPAHVEVRIDKNGNICPIEINPARFGGWCTTGDLSWHSFGFNSYDYYHQQLEPDWNEIFKTKGNKKYSIIILNNSSGIPAEQIKTFNYDLINSDLENILVLRRMDIKKYPVFGFIFAETSPKNDQELDQILTADLKRYIEKW